MVLILTNTCDQTTNDVIAWLHNLGSDFVRVNVEDFIDVNTALYFSSKNNSICAKLTDKLETTVESNSDLSIWFRRWAKPSKLNVACNTESLEYQLSEFLSEQIDEYQKGFFKSFRHARWLNNIDNLDITKLNVLYRAIECGLTIPETIITTKKKDLEAFLKENEKVITKTIAETQFFHKNDSIFGLYTSLIDNADLASIADTFPPTLFQVCIEKNYEIRVFYLNGKFFSMAIFSQSNSKTKVDFREYDESTPNRNVPYLLPKAIEDKLEQLCSLLKLNCCSFDLIKSTDNNYIFLEVNPVGQFGMVSFPCNYHLEEKVANYLIKAM